MLFLNKIYSKSLKDIIVKYMVCMRPMLSEGRCKGFKICWVNILDFLYKNHSTIFQLHGNEPAVSENCIMSNNSWCGQTINYFVRQANFTWFANNVWSFAQGFTLLPSSVTFINIGKCMLSLPAVLYVSYMFPNHLEIYSDELNLILTCGKNGETFHSALSKCQCKIWNR